MPSFVLTTETIAHLGVAHAVSDLREATLPVEYKMRLAGMLKSVGFDLDRAIYVRELVDSSGFLLTQ